MEFTDKKLLCRECGVDFLFTAGEQAFFLQKGLVNEPGRCPECRLKRKQNAQASGATEATVHTPAPVVEGQPVPTTSSVREVTVIHCAECGTETTVPFRPRLARPVYCSSCYNKQRTAQALAAAVSTGGSDS